MCTSNTATPGNEDALRRKVDGLIFCLLLFYVLSNYSKVILGRVPSCDSAHTYKLYSAAPLGNQTASTMTCNPTESHYPDTEPPRPFPYSNNAEHHRQFKGLT